ncbi:cation:proton antiporter domain-containing protein [Treponema denticola]|uniref:cation:proton antiporter domain-containing protein n=1 Tax=Treponema denticola TaxID=158 RepID=UPI0002DF2B3A|nr:cation:proton antiporter [Treponema denticola]
MNKLAEFLPAFMHFSRLENTNLILLLGIILLLGALGGTVFKKLKIPQVVGYIVIGIIIGQSGFQILSAQIITALDPLSSIALALIGFLIGGELKTKVIKKYGTQFVGILIFESIVPFITVSIVISLVAYFVTKNFAASFSIGLILGSISSATAPAATTDVLRENRTKGPLTTTVLGIVAMDDAVALVLYALASSIAASLLGAQTASFGKQILLLLYNIFGSICLGSLIGFLLSLIIRNMMTDSGRILGFSLGSLLLSTGIAYLLGLDTILAAMALGFFMVNFAPAKTRSTFTLVENFTPPIYVLFFVLVGAKLNIWNVTPFIGLLALLYVILRTVGKTIGAILGSVLTKAPEPVKKYLPFCLLSQAGVAIGLSISAGQDFSDTIGPTILLIVTATTFIVQLVGPIFVKYGVKKSGECGLDVTEEDLITTLSLGDVMLNGKAICSPESPAIISENMPLNEIIDSFSHSPNLNYAVKGDDGRLTGVISLEHLKETLTMTAIYDCVFAMDIMQPADIVCSQKTGLKDLYELYTEKDTYAIPIIGDNGEPLGMAEKDAVDHFLHGKIIELHKNAYGLD